MNASWVSIDLMEFAVRTEDAVQSPEAALEWLRSFRDTMLMGGRNSRPMPWVVELLATANIKVARKSLSRMKGQIVKIHGKDCDVDLECSKMYGEKYEKLKEILAQDAPNGNAGVDVSDAGNGAKLKSPTSCDQLTADGDIREDSQAKPDGSAITRNETRAHDALEPSANHYATRQAKNGDAATREGAEVLYSRESGDSVPTTVSRNMRRVPQNEAPAHGFSGGRTAQGTMSRSPEAAAQSGKDYDQVPDADKHKQGDDNTADTAPDRGPESGKHSGKPASISTNDPAETAPSHGGSVASLEARQSQHGAGGNSVRRVAKVSTPPALPAKRPHGEFGNVLLTDDELAKLCERCQDADSLITELDQYIESQGKARKYKSHYATLLNWSRRKAQEAKPKQGYKNINDINRETYEKSKREIHAMFHPEEAKAV